MGDAVVVSATMDILPFLREQLDGKNREEAFDMPFVYGQGICHLPDLERLMTIPVTYGVEIVCVTQPDIKSLYIHKGFSYAIWYEAHNRPETLVTVAYVDGAVAGMAGASDDCNMMWQIGINVLPEYRGRGIAAALTNRLMMEILECGKIPYYGAATSNIASQRTAHRAGFRPAWYCVYRGMFDDVLTEPTS
jgi:GNAT superfamily N-acetyltransferase